MTSLMLYDKLNSVEKRIAALQQESAYFLKEINNKISSFEGFNTFYEGFKEFREYKTRNIDYKKYLNDEEPLPDIELLNKIHEKYKDVTINVHFSKLIDIKENCERIGKEMEECIREKNILEGTLELIQ